MQVNNNSNINFNGYDARPLKSLCMTYNGKGIAKELSEIGKKVGFDVFVATTKRKMVSVADIENPRGYSLGSIWAQDIATITPNKEFLGQSCFVPYIQTLKEKFPKFSYRFEIETIPAGGNYYFVRNKDGSQKLLSGMDAHLHMHDNPKWLKEVYGIENVDYIPQMDFHIDLFLRPLDNNRVLLADDSMTIDLIKNAIEKFGEYGKSNFYKPSGIKALVVKYKLAKTLKNYEQVLSSYKYKYVDAKVVGQVLKEKGFDVINVPGRVLTQSKYIETEHNHLLNYMNAIATKDKKGDLVYITNKSLLDKHLGITDELAKKVGFCFENAFLDSIASVVKKDNVYFVKGEKNALPKMLKDLCGGIHCMVTEIPEVV